MTASNVNDARKEYARTLYANNASAHAKLWLVPANMSSFRDVDSLVDWIGTEQKVTVGKDVKVTKPALTPTLVFPFAAPRVSGSLADAGPAAENQARLLLWSVERTIAGVADLASRGVGSPRARGAARFPEPRHLRRRRRPTAKSRQPSMPSWRNGPLKASGRTTCPSPRPASAGWLVLT